MLKHRLHPENLIFIDDAEENIMAACNTCICYQIVPRSAGMSFLDLVSMTLTRVDPVIIVENKIRALEAGMSDHDVTIQQLQSHYLAGGNVTLLMDTMIAARRKSAVLTFSEASELDLAGKL